MLLRLSQLIQRKRLLADSNFRSQQAGRSWRRALWLIALCLPAFTTSSSLLPDPSLDGKGTLLSENDKTRGKESSFLNWSQILPALKEALSDASIHSSCESPAPSSSERRARRRRWQKRWKRFRGACNKVAKSSTGVASVADSPLLATTAMAAASVEREVKDPPMIGPKLERMHDAHSRSDSHVTRKARMKRSKKQQKDLHISDHSELDAETLEGARLISASFAVLANTFGLLADSVRVMGDTAAGITGSSVKLVGTAVKSVSSGLDSASRVLEPNKTSSDESSSRRKPLTSERLMERKRGIERDYARDKTGLLGNTRHVAANSIRLLGSVVRGFGHTLVLAGGATESITASAAGVAEDVVRIVESFAESVSFAVGKNLEDDIEHEQTEPTFDSFLDFPDDDEEPLFVSYGAFPDTDESSYPSQDTPTVAESFVHRLMTSERGTMVMALIDLIGELCSELLIFVMADTEGVPSFGPQLLGVMFLCYLAALLTLSSRKETPPLMAKRRPEVSSRWTGVLHLAKQEAEVAKTENLSLFVSRHDPDFDDDSASDQDSLPTGVDQTKKSSMPEKKKSTTTQICTWKGSFFMVMKDIAFMPWKVVCFLFLCMFRVLFCRLSALLVLYGIGWLYLCRVSQLRSATILKKGESIGFRSAVSSIGTTSPTVAESVVWLNTLLNQIWRVQYHPGSSIGQQWSNELLSYPLFVTRARENSVGRKLRRNSLGANGSPGLLPYGGLEPYISSSIGRSLLNILDSSKASRPNDVAYVSLHSFTLGGTPPLIRSMELRGVERGGQIAQYLMDVDAVLDDFSLVVEVKLSSLEYALIPSTKISIHSLEMRVPLQLSLSARPDYPYVSKLRLSLAHAPDCKIGITPLSDDSGLRGVDLGSLPVINDWIREVIKESLSEYVSPKYINIDLGRLLSSSSRKSSSPTPTVPDISKLRQKTRENLDPTPRTVSAGGVTMTSVAEHLASHHSAIKAADSFISTPTRPPFLVKPKTELAQMGMDRWAAKFSGVEQEEAVAAEEDREQGFVGTLTNSFSIVAPFVIAIAAGVFRDRILDDKALMNHSNSETRDAP